MLKLLTHIRLPSGTGQLVKDLRREHEFLFRFRDLVQIDSRHAEYQRFSLFRRWLPAFDTPNDCFLMFRDVSEHQDDWGQIRHKGRYVAPAFLHLVLHGKMRLRVGKKTQDFRRGDLLVMDMNRRHEVVSHTLCITATVTVPRMLYS